jgi:hypothetical protein
MSSRAAKCEAKGDVANCTSPRCPERIAHLQVFASAWTTIEAPVAPVKRQRAPKPFAGKLPFTKGSKLNERQLRLTLHEPFDSKKVRPLRNIVRETFLKPKGGVWLAPDSDYGTAYETALNLTPEDGSVRHEVRFKDDARIVMVNSRADYQRLLDAYPHNLEKARRTPEEAARVARGPWGGTAQEAFDDDGEPRRGIDYVKLAKDYDGLYVTEAGLAACSEPSPHDISLRSWAFESGIVLNPKAVEVTVTDLWSTEED